MDAIVAATRIGAMTIGRSADMGTLEPGKLADFALLAKNPLDDIDNVRSVAMTVKRGSLFRRSDYRPIAQDEARGEM